MKKYLLTFLIILSVFCITGCESDPNKKKDQDGYLIGTSNVVDDSKLQIKVIIEKINIREKPEVSSNKLGVVEKDSVFDVIEYTKDKNYLWIKIKTDNDINGYVASDLESPYVEFNQDIDINPPKITIKSNNVSATTRKEAESAIIKNINYEDDKDINPKVEYKINYENRVGIFQYAVEVTVTDSSNNSSTVQFVIKFTGEKMMKDGKWITYQEMVNLQKKAKSLCTKYNMKQWNDGIGCQLQDGIHDISIGNSGTTRIGYVDPFTFCDYNLSSLEATYCVDGGGNNISHDLIPNNLKSLESVWMKRFENYKKDVKNTTGYELSDLTW